MKVSDLLTPQPKQGAGTLIYAQQDRKFLFILRSELVNSPLTWGIPGGTVDPGETPGPAAIRETLEEVGYDITGNPRRLIYINKTYLPRFEFYNYAVIVPRVFKPVINWEIDQTVWCDLADIPHPRHWGLDMLMSNDIAATKLKEFLEEVD